MRKAAIAISAALSVLGLSASAGSAPLSIRDNFRIGTSGTIFCSAQSLPTDKALVDMFDAGYSVTCRDAALPVGKMYKLRDIDGGAARLAALRSEDVTSTEPTTAEIADVGRVRLIESS